MNLTPISFEQMIANLVREGAANIKIERAESSIGCIKKGDIMAIEVTSQRGSIFIASVCDPFGDAPIIKVDRLFRNCHGRCTDRYTIKRYLYVH